MRRAGLLLLPLLLSGPVASFSAAQTPPAAVPIQPATAQPASTVTPVKLGDSAIELGGLWKFHTGDNPEWAQPGFDDSAWPTLDLTPPEGSADATLGTSGFIPGWTSTGYPDYSGYAWYRLHINVEQASRPLALKMPDSADDAYQLYVNGSLLGEFGKFGAHHVTAYSTQPREFRLPRKLRGGPVTIAIRMWMDSATPFVSPDAGGMHAPPVLGFASVIATQTRLDWDDLDHDVGSGFLEILILIMALIMAIALASFDHEEKAYRWLALVCTVTLLGNCLVLLANFTTLIGQTQTQFSRDVILTPLRIGMWVIFWGYWFRLSRLRRLHEAVWSMVALLAAGSAMLRPPLYGVVIPAGSAAFLVPGLLVVKLILAVLLFLVAYFGFRKRKSEGWPAFVAMLLAAIANYQHELRLIHVKITTTVFDYTVSIGTISTVLSLLIITAMLLVRFFHSERLKQQWKLEIQQAREVQQVLIPSRPPRIQGLRIESEYLPAREVGGDFFQILPGDVAGTALIVLGDVTGKGMQAGMLVALIVGAIRTAVSQRVFDPASILMLINDELCSREHASATCLVLRIGAEGDIQLANAGQIPPYLNGAELELEGALPLGTVSGLDYSNAAFRLELGDSLILMSDGIVEAQDEDGMLFGFERLAELLKRQISAAEIASIAQKFGQEDDILVLRIEREAAAI